MRDITHVPIGSRRYAIKWDKEECDRLSEDLGCDNEITYGVCDHTRRTIWLNPKAHSSIEAALETLIHEGLHVCEPFVGAKVKHPTVDAFAVNLCGILVGSGVVDPGQLTIAGWSDAMLAEQAE